MYILYVLSFFFFFFFFFCVDIVDDNVNIVDEEPHSVGYSAINHYYYYYYYYYKVGFFSLSESASLPFCSEVADYIPRPRAKYWKFE